MKVLIVFFALTMLNSMFFIYQNDMNRYIRENTYIKNTAEEAAGGASLFYDEEALSEGYYVFNREECEKYVRYIIDNSFNEKDDVSYEISYLDDGGTGCPAIEVIITAGGKDRFRLSFLEKKKITRAACYENKGY